MVVCLFLTECYRVPLSERFLKTVRKLFQHCRPQLKIYIVCKGSGKRNLRQASKNQFRCSDRKCLQKGQKLGQSVEFFMFLFQCMSKLVFNCCKKCLSVSLLIFVFNLARQQKQQQFKLLTEQPQQPRFNYCIDTVRLL